MGVSNPDADLSNLSMEQRVRRLRALNLPPTSTGRKPRILWELAIIAISMLALGLLWPFSKVATADYPGARQLADHLEAVLEPVWRGESSMEDLALSTDLALYQFTDDGRTTSILTHVQPTAFGTCYGVRIGGGLVTASIRFTPTVDTCVPQGQTAYDESGAWSEVLPPQWRTEMWFVPAVAVFGGAALASASRIAVKLMFK